MSIPRSLILALALVAGTSAGCIVAEVDSCSDVECGENAYCDRGICECVGGFSGDADDICDPIQTVLLQDDCDDGLDIEFAIHAMDREWRWPEGSDVFSTPGLDVSSGLDFVCREGEYVCFGAQAGPLVWGVGLDNTDVCEDDWCCFECYADVVDLGLLNCP